MSSPKKSNAGVRSLAIYRRIANYREKFPGTIDPLILPDLNPHLSKTKEKRYRNRCTLDLPSEKWISKEPFTTVIDSPSISDQVKLFAKSLYAYRLIAGATLRSLWFFSDWSQTSPNCVIVTNLGLSYHLLTEYTSFLAVDSEVREAAEGTKKESVTQPLPLPQGVNHTAVGGGSIPEPSMSLLLLLALLVLLLQRPRRAVA